MTTARIIWSEFEVEVLRKHYATTLTTDLADLLNRPVSRLLAKANALGLKKSRELIAETARKRIEEDPSHGSRRTRIQPGTPPPNKGLKHPPGWAPGRMADTQFKPGKRPHTWVPVGSLTVNADGYLDRKVADGQGPRHKFWKPVHRLVWEEANGPVPDGHVVVFKVGRKSTDPALITLDAVELVTRSELMRRNSFHNNYPPELVEITRLRAQITRQINNRRKEEQT